MTDTTTLFYADGTEHQGAGKAVDRIQGYGRRRHHHDNPTV